MAARRHFDDDLLELKQELLALDGDTGVALPDTIEGIQAALTVAMPIYLTHWWPEHDGANRRWSASVMQPLRRHEARYVEITTRLYGSRWPQARRIDVSAYANARAGYTAIGHTVMFSTDPGNQGLYAFEMLLHEVQHTRDVAPTARQELAHAFEGSGGRATRQTCGMRSSSPPPAPSPSGWPSTRPSPRTPRTGSREGFEDLQGWSELLPPVLEHWVPAVRGESTTPEAFARTRSQVRESLRRSTRARLRSLKRPPPDLRSSLYEPSLPQLSPRSAPRSSFSFTPP